MSIAWGLAADKTHRYRAIMIFSYCCTPVVNMLIMWTAAFSVPLCFFLVLLGGA